MDILFKNLYPVKIESIKMVEKVPVNPEILKWARNTAGYSIGWVVKEAKIKGIKDTKKKKGITAVERLEQWENGHNKPTFQQLKDLAKVYKRPEITFFLTSPPIKEEKLMDYRTIESKETVKDTPEFSQFKRRIEILQEDLSAIVKEQSQKPLSFVGTFKTTDSINKIVVKAREILSFSFIEQLKTTNYEDLLRVLRDKVQGAGIYVLFQGNLGSHHTNISLDEFRGIAIADVYAPLVVINPNDYKTAQIFSLLHEFAHILLGDDSISNAAVYKTVTYSKKEQFCNSFAAEFLLPAHELENIKEIKTSLSALDEAKSISQKYKLGTMGAIRRLYDTNKISRNIFLEANSIIMKNIRENKNKKKEKGGTGPDKNRLDRYRLGAKTLETVLGAAYEGKISTYDASFLLSISPSRFEKVLGV